MVKKRIFALTVMVCILVMGVVYGKWSKRLNVGLETKSGVLKYEIGDISECKVSILSNNVVYEVAPEKLEFKENNNKELVIKLSEEQLKNVFGNNGKITEIQLEYAAKPSDKNSIYSVDIDKELKTHTAEIFSNKENKTEKNQENIATSGEIISPIKAADENKVTSDKEETDNEENNKEDKIGMIVNDNEIGEMVNRIIKCVTSTSSEYIISDEGKYIQISHNTKLEDYEFKSGDIFTIDYDDVIEQKNKDDCDKNRAISETYCLWTQKIKLQCRIIITE